MKVYVCFEKLKKPRRRWRGGCQSCGNRRTCKSMVLWAVTKWCRLAWIWWVWSGRNRRLCRRRLLLPTLFWNRGRNVWRYILLCLPGRGYWARSGDSICTTAFDKKGRVVCTGQNEYTKSHPWQKHLSIKAGMSEERVFYHSEVKALLTAKNLKKKVHTLKVERYDCNGNPRLAMPCPSCMIAIHLTGVNVLYSQVKMDGKNCIYNKGVIVNHPALKGRAWSRKTTS